MTRPRVAVLDYGSGNIRSAQRALERAGADTEITADWDTALNADGLVVPGVGAFADCMNGLKALPMPAAMAASLKLLVKSIVGRLTAAVPKALRKNRTCNSSSLAISIAYCWIAGVINGTWAPPVTAPAFVPASASESPDPVVALR